MEKDKKGINHTSTDEHKELCDIMSGFMDNGKPKVGIFWYNVALGTLFGVEKEDAENVPFVNGKATIHKLHKTYWQKSTTEPRQKVTPRRYTTKNTTTS